MDFQDGDEVDEEVIKVDRRAGFKPLLILAVDLRGDRLDVVARAFGEHLGGDQVVLGATDGVVDPLGGDAGVGEVELFHRVLDGSEAVRLVEDREPTVDPDQGGVGPEQPGAEGVESADPDVRLRGEARRFAPSSRPPPCW